MTLIQVKIPNDKRDFCTIKPTAIRGFGQINDNSTPGMESRFELEGARSN